MVRAKKRFGQNFLKDRTILEQIIKAIPDDDYQLVEIGAGLGDLTKYLLVSNGVVAFEIDLDLCNYLNSKFSEELENGKLELFCKDVIAVWREELYSEKYKIVANLPYYIATNIIFKALQDRNCKSITAMVQKEVADKFVAKVGEKNFSMLSVVAQSAGKVVKVVDVPPTAFQPMPKVYSAVVQVRKEIETISHHFISFLQIAFKQPRKTLLKNLSQHYERDRLETLFFKLNLNLSIRPHQVDTPIYHQIYQTLEDREIGRE